MVNTDENHLSSSGLLISYEKVNLPKDSKHHQTLLLFLIYYPKEARVQTGSLSDTAGYDKYSPPVRDSVARP